MKDRMGKSLDKLTDAAACIVHSKDGRKFKREKGVIQAVHPDTDGVTVAINGKQQRVAASDVQLT